MVSVHKVHKNDDKQVSSDKQVFHYFQYVEKYLNVCYIIICLNFSLKTTFNQSDFKQGDSCIYQLLSITHETYQSFDNIFEVRSISFLISPNLLIKIGTKVLFLN